MNDGALVIGQTTNNNLNKISRDGDDTIRQDRESNNEISVVRYINTCPASMYNIERLHDSGSDWLLTLDGDIFI